LKLVFFILCIITCHAYAADKLLLVTSFEHPEQNLRRWSSKRRNLHHGVEEIFRGSFIKETFELEIIHYLDSYQLYKKIKSGSYRGIFWISHANKGDPLNGEGIATQHLILDREGINLKDLFKHLHPDTSYLGLIGCHTNQAAAEIVSSFPKTGKEIMVHGFDQEIDILKGLRKSIKAFKKQFSGQVATHISSPQNSEKLPVNVIRKADAIELPPLFVYNQRELITVVPSVPAFSRQETQIKLQKSTEPFKLKLVFSTNQIHPGKTNDQSFGEIELHPDSSAGGGYELLSTGDRPLGTRSRIFIYNPN
jgi:hypothetical protein